MIAEQTGYTVDMLEPDLDLEADLGIDTVKQVEVFGRVSARFGLATPEDLNLRDLNTIARLAAWVGGQKTVAEPKTETVTGPASGVVPEPVSRVRRFAVRAVSTPLPAPGPNPFEGATVLVTADRFGFAEAVGVRIKELGGTVVAMGPDTISDPETATASIAALLAENPSVRGLIHLAPLDLVFDPESDAQAGMAMVRTFFAMVKALGPVLDQPGSLLALMGFDSVVFPYGEDSEKTGRIVPAIAGMAGLMKSAAKEMPAGRFKVVDFSHEDPLVHVGGIIDTFLVEIASTDHRVESGYARDGRFVLSLEPSAPTAGRRLVQRGDTVLVTGGARGITYEILRAMVAQTDLHLVIVGRSDIRAEAGGGVDSPADREGLIQEMKRRMPGARPVAIRQAADRERQRRQTVANIEALRSAGARVDYHAADVTDSVALSAVLAAHERIDGVVHGAGIDMSRFMAQKDQKEFDRVFHTKVLGTQCLLDALEERPWRFFVGFSSVTARFGNEAQTDYTAANDMMGKMLQKQARMDRSRVCKVLDWTAWEGAGMATDETIKQVLTEKGLTFLPLAEGVAFFMAELDAPVSEEVAFAAPDPALDRDGLFAAGSGATVAVAPFLDERLTADDDRAVFGRTLDLQRDLFLLDHSREGVPIFLGATGIEAMAEAAAEIMGDDRTPVELVDFNIPYGIKILKGRAKPIRIEARRQAADGTMADCRITSRFHRPDNTPMGEETLHYRGTFRFGDRPVAAEPVFLPDLAPVEFETGVPELVYHPSRLFMDGLFRTVEEILFMDAAMLVTRLRRPTGRPFFAGVVQPDFLTDVVLVDAMFQSCGILAFMTTGDVVLPQTIGRMGFCQRPEETGDCLCKVVKSAEDETHITFGIDLVDRQGTPFLQVENFKMVRVDKLPADDPMRKQVRSARLRMAS